MVKKLPAIMAVADVVAMVALEEKQVLRGSKELLKKYKIILFSKHSLAVLLMLHNMSHMNW